MRVSGHAQQVADFGESKQYDTGLADEEGRDDLTLTMRGTFIYMAPEVLEGKRYNASVDVFAFSLVLQVHATLPTLSRYAN